MKELATHSKKEEPVIYKSKEEVFAAKRKQMNEVLSKVDPEQLRAVLDRKR